MTGPVFDRQPPLRFISPEAAVTVFITARNEEVANGDTVLSLAPQDCEGPLRVIVIDNGSTDRAGEVARITTKESGFAIDNLVETTPGKSNTLNLGLASVMSTR